MRCRPTNASKRVRHYLEMMGLWERRNDMVVGFSKGMRQKLAIARSLIHDPKMLFLDEPTASLDPEASKMVHDFIIELRKEGHTIFLCTHNLDEADRLCDRIGVMKQTMIRVDSQANLRRSLYGRKVVLQLTSVTPEISAAIKALPFVKSIEQDGRSLTIALDKPDEQNPALVRAVLDAGGEHPVPDRDEILARRRLLQPGRPGRDGRSSHEEHRYQLAQGMGDHAQRVV